MTYNSNLERSIVIKEALSSSDVKVNLFAMIVISGVVVFNFFMILFLANTFERVYEIGLIFSIADIISYLLGGILAEKSGVRTTFGLSFTVSTLAGILILLYGL